MNFVIIAMFICALIVAGVIGSKATKFLNKYK